MPLKSQLGTVKEVGTPTTVTGIAPTAGTPNIGTITFSGAHGLRQYDVLTLTGATPAGWNGSFLVMQIPSTTTAVISTGTTLLTATTVQPTATASGWAIPGTPARFFEYNTETMKRVNGRSKSTAVRAGTRVERSDRFVPYVTSSKGTISLEVLSKGFGFWLEHLLGAVATTGPTDSAYTHTATIADLVGKGFTLQINRPLAAAGFTDQPFTWTGCKVAKWTLECDTQGLCVFTADIICQGELVNVVLATASYPAASELLSWVGGKVQINAVQVDVTKWKLSCDNMLDDSRLFLRENSLIKEPVEKDLRAITVEFTCDWDDLTHYQRFVATTASGALAAVIVEAKSPTMLGATPASLPALRATMTAVDLGDLSTGVAGQQEMSQAITGIVKFDGTNSALQLQYVTADSTP